MAAADHVHRLNVARQRAAIAATSLASATLIASQALAEVERAFAEAGCTDNELDAGIAAARATLATTSTIQDALELARDSCESLAADL